MTGRWILLPGMGASSHMYNGLRRLLRFRVDFINWPAYRGESSYSEVAKRVIDENNISGGDIVGGSSLGGMVALEIAEITNAKAVILIGSAMHAGEVQTLLALLSPLAAVTPMSVIQTVAGKYGSLVSTMFSESDAEFVRAMCLYLPHWKGRPTPAARVFRIHGRNDHVIPCPSGNCEVVNDAGHLLAITHPKEVAAFLEEIRTEISEGA